MPITTDRAKHLFDNPYYLERGRHVINARDIIVQDLLSTKDCEQVLDLGCGDGSLSLPLVYRVRKLFLIDLSTRMLEIAASRVPAELRNRVTVVHTELSKFKPTAPFDVVLCVGVLAHVPDIEDAVMKISECLKPGGVAIIEFTPNPNPLGKFFWPYYLVRRKFTRDIMGYSTNKIPLSTLLEIAKRHGLFLKQLRRHYFPIPTMAWWPQQLLAKYTMFLMRSKLLSRFGTEHIMLFTKNQHPHL